MRGLLIDFRRAMTVHRILWALSVIAFGLLAGLKTAKAQHRSCDSGFSALGTRYYYNCFFLCPDGQDVCETDYCGGTCPEGSISYCVSAQYCGNPMTNGCLEYTCT